MYYKQCLLPITLNIEVIESLKLLYSLNGIKPECSLLPKGGIHQAFINDFHDIKINFVFL